MTIGGALTKRLARTGTVGLGSLAAAALFGLPLMLGACSVAEVFGSDDSRYKSSDLEYPDLSNVPGQAPRPSPDSLRKELIKGLIADHANARYSDEDLTAWSAAVPPATAPAGGQPRVEVRWQMPRTGGVEEEVEEVEEVGEAADTPPGAEGEAGEYVEISWDTPRVLPEQTAEAAAEATAEAAAEAAEASEAMAAGGTQLVAVIYFAHDSSQLNDEDRDVLRDVVALHKENGGRIHLIGHSSQRADTEDLIAQRMVNLDLSLKRASEVAETLMGLGAEQEALLVEAMADSEPVAEEASVTGEAVNRRVEIFLEY